MTHIQKVAVIGSGVMGSAIAAHIANAGTQVILIDIVPEGEKKRNMLAESAIERMLKADPAPFTHKNKANLITPANLEDNIDLLSDADWIIEAVLERLDIKHGIYKRIDEVRKKGSIVSSNTSTLPLHKLVEGQSDEFKKDFLISHFFNPPRYMRLLEIVKGEHTRDDAVATISEYGDIHLGKGIVPCNDTPGFIANRIGCYWLTLGLLQAIEQNITVEEADAVMSKPIGVPKTGVFGLMDLIGIDLLPLIATSFNENLDPEDAFRKIYQEPKIVTDMIADGYTGRKGLGGFYRLNTEGKKKVKEAKNLQTGEYVTAERPSVAAAKAAKNSLRDMLTYSDAVGTFAYNVVTELLAYTASLVPEISDDIAAIDEAMKLGYNWKYGPFELIDKLSNGEQSGAAWLAAELEKNNKPVPELLTKVGNDRFYKQDESGATQIYTASGYQTVAVDPAACMLADITRSKEPVMKNASARVWDIGDELLCVEYTSKMNAVDPLTLEALNAAIDLVEEKQYKGLIIANDSDNFCVGANIGFALFAANIGSWKMIEEMVENGQKTYMRLKYAPFPVVTAVSGMALGGGCEILLHSDAVQAHIETYTGLVEVGVGIIPGWGGCKEMLLRRLAARRTKGGLAALGRAFEWINPVKSLNTLPAIRDVFMQIGLAKVAKSAEQAREMFILNDNSRITMNRKRLLADAKDLCLELSKDYTAPDPETQNMQLPGKTARAALHMGINDFVKSGKATPHDEIVSKGLADVLSGGDTDITERVTEQDILDLERAVFMTLIKTKGSLDRMEHMLETGKPLRN